MLGCIFTIITLATGGAAGADIISFWWVLLPAFFAGSLGLSNSHHYGTVMEANRRGSMTFFPLMLGIYIGGQVILAAIVYWITGAVS